MPIKIDRKTYFDVIELAEILHLKESTIRDYLRTGKLKGRKIGRLWHVDKRDLKLFISGI